MRKLLAVMHEELKHLSAGALTPTTLLTELSSRHRWDRTALDAQQLKWKSSSERHLAGLQRVVVEETMLQFEALEAQLLLPASFPLRHLEVAAVGCISPCNWRMMPSFARCIGWALVCVLRLCWVVSGKVHCYISATCNRAGRSAFGEELAGLGRGGPPRQQEPRQS